MIRQKIGKAWLILLWIGWGLSPSCLAGDKIPDTLYADTTVTIYMDNSQTFVKDQETRLEGLDKKFGPLLKRLFGQGLMEARFVYFSGRIVGSIPISKTSVDNFNLFSNWGNLSDGDNESNYLEVLNDIGNPKKNHEIAFIIGDFIHESIDCDSKKCLEAEKAYFTSTLESKDPPRGRTIFLIDFPHKTTSKDETFYKTIPIHHDIANKYEDFAFKINPEDLGSFSKLYHEKVKNTIKIIDAKYTSSPIKQIFATLRGFELDKEEITSASFFLDGNDTPHEIKQDQIKFLPMGAPNRYILLIENTQFTPKNGSKFSIILHKRYSNTSKSSPEKIFHSSIEGQKSWMSSLPVKEDLHFMVQLNSDKIERVILFSRDNTFKFDLQKRNGKFSSIIEIENSGWELFFKGLGKDENVLAVGTFRQSQIVEEAVKWRNSVCATFTLLLLILFWIRGSKPNDASKYSFLITALYMILSSAPITQAFVSWTHNWTHRGLGGSTLSIMTGAIPSIIIYLSIKYWASKRYAKILLGPIQYDHSLEKFKKNHEKAACFFSTVTFTVIAGYVYFQFYKVG